MEILDIFFGSIIGEYDENKVKEIAFSNKRKKKSIELALIGEDDVIRAYNDLLNYNTIKNQSKNSEKDYEEVRLFARLLIEIRKSLGYKKTKLTDVDILKPFIADAEKLGDNVKR